LVRSQVGGDARFGLRLAAFSLIRSHSYLGAYLRRQRSPMGWYDLRHVTQVHVRLLTDDPLRLAAFNA